MNFKIVFLFAIVGSCLVSSCSVKDPIPLGAQTNAVLLAGEVGKSKTWKLIDFSYSVGTTPSATVSYPCFKDNTYTFYNTKEQEYKDMEGDSKCNTDDPDLIESGVWSLSLDGNYLLVGVNDTFSGNGLFSPDIISISKDAKTWSRQFSSPYPAKITKLIKTDMVLEITNSASRPAEVETFTLKFSSD